MQEPVVARPRNHERYTAEKPFAGGHDFGPGKGLRRLRSNGMDYDPLDIFM